MYMGANKPVWSMAQKVNKTSSLLHCCAPSFNFSHHISENSSSNVELASSKFLLLFPSLWFLTTVASEKLSGPTGTIWETIKPNSSGWSFSRRMSSVSAKSSAASQRKGSRQIESLAVSSLLLRTFVLGFPNKSQAAAVAAVASRTNKAKVFVKKEQRDTQRHCLFLHGGAAGLWCILRGLHCVRASLLVCMHVRERERECTCMCAHLRGNLCVQGVFYWRANDVPVERNEK